MTIGQISTCHLPSQRAPHLLGYSQHPPASARSTMDLVPRRGKSTAARFAAVSVSHVSGRHERLIHRRSALGGKNEPAVHLTVTKRSRILSSYVTTYRAAIIRVADVKRVRTQEGRQRTCGSRKVCVSVTVATRCKPAPIGTPEKKYAFRSLGLRAGVHASILTCARSQKALGYSLFHVKQNARRLSVLLGPRCSP
jgi:hypothetical protein